MLRIRRFEESAASLYRDGEIPGFLHLSIGQEAVAVGVCSALRRSDAIVSTHRGHGHCLAKGVDMSAMFAELFGRASGTGRGLGGSMHIADLDAGVYGANGIVGAGLPIGVGVAAAFALNGRDDIVAVFFGEGAIAQGAFHESLNLATLWRLPVLFVCENNQYAEFSRLADQQPVEPTERARAYGLPASSADGNDVAKVACVAAAEVRSLRGGGGPRLLELVTLRRRGHYEGDPQRYRPVEEAEEWAGHDPLAVSSARIALAGGADALASVELLVERELEQALASARNGPVPEAGMHSRFVFRSSPEPSLEPGPDEQSEPIRYIDALRAALEAELRADPSVWIAGIDVGAGGGVYGVTRGIADQFPGRVRDTPISETAVMGLAVGGAMAGTKPVVELMYIDFLGVCLDQLMNQAAKMHFMTGGAATMSLVVRTQFAAGRSSGPQHSQSLEGIFAQFPGLKVVMPATPADAYGLLRAAIRDPNPVVFVENSLLYGAKGPPPVPGGIVPIGKARVARSGDDVTVVTWSRMFHDVFAAAELLAKRGTSVEVVDLRTVVPFDRAAIAASVEGTGKLLVAQEAVLGTGVGASIAAWAADELFWSLDAPVKHVAPAFTPPPYARELEAEWLPGVEAIAAEIEQLAAL
jgi:2-oxoisovalerate dehydrogenase E1 component